jgi:hypothetical protein
MDQRSRSLRPLSPRRMPAAVLSTLALQLRRRAGSQGVALAAHPAALTPLFQLPSVSRAKSVPISAWAEAHILRFRWSVRYQHWREQVSPEAERWFSLAPQLYLRAR